MILEAVGIYKNGKILLRQPKITMIIMGKFLLDNIVRLISAIESEGSQIKQTGIPILIAIEASTSLKDSKIALLKD